MNKEYTCSFTGHRKIGCAAYSSLGRQLFTKITQLIQKGYTFFCSGGALGFDLLAAQTVIRLKEDFPSIRLCMILPCRNQDKFWTEAQKAEYQAVLRNADEVIYTSEAYYRGCMLKRNRIMVDASSYVLAFLENETGGTKYTVDYAVKHGITLEFLSSKPA